MIFSSKQILVIGDVMIDRYEIGSISRISPEAPVPVFLMKETKLRLGGAANVAANLLAARQQVSICSVIGKDAAGDALLERLEEQQINCKYILRSTDRKTTSKTRIMAQSNQQLLRLDEETTEVISIEQTDLLLAQVKADIHKFSAILLSDYMKGVLSPYLCNSVIQLANQHGIPVMIDVKDRNIEKYSDAFLLKPNLLELRMLTGMPANTIDEIKAATRYLLEKSRCKYVLSTLGGTGMYIVGGDGFEYFAKAKKREVYDVSGAGDTAISYFSAAIVSGLSIQEAVDFANLAAGLKVTKQGTGPVFLEEAIAEMDQMIDRTKHSSKKIISREECARLRENYKDKKIVFTNGCFDILHAGHVIYLQEAAHLGDILIVGLNNDESVRLLKGPNRPINTELDRATIMAALGAVDYVVFFGESTPIDLIHAVRPDVLVKGGDYHPNDIVGADFVRENGGEVTTIPVVEGKSTTETINKMKR